MRPSPPTDEFALAYLARFERPELDPPAERARPGEQTSAFGRQGACPSDFYRADYAVVVPAPDGDRQRFTVPPGVAVCSMCASDGSSRRRRRF